MTRREVVLAALAAGDSASHTPVQIQKLLFLIDRKVGDKLGGPHFNFKPYNYGPFDAEVYRTLDELAADGLVVIRRNSELRLRQYLLTPKGQEWGEKLLTSIAEELREYMRRLSTTVRLLKFNQLVTAIYRAYPEMKKNSIFS